MVWSFRSLIFLILFLSAGFPPELYAIDSPEDADLWTAFRKIIPLDRQGNDPLARLREAHAIGDEGRTELDQVLKDYRATSLKGFLQELDGRLDRRRLAMTDAERRFHFGSASISEVSSILDDYSRDRLTVQELAAVIQFYQDRDPKVNTLIQRQGLRRADAETARLALGVTKFPFTPAREHNEDQPLVPYTENMRQSWIKTFSAFYDRGLRYEFSQLWSQMVNVNSGNRRFRHIEGFEERFVYEVRRHALQEDEFRAKDLLIAYLSNHASNKTLDRVGDRPDSWTPEQTKEIEGTMAEFLARFANIRDRASLRKFFDTGQLPPSFGNLVANTKSIQLERMFRVISAAQKTKNANSCIKLLGNLARKYERP
jgi:hypothetical protein